MNGLFFIRRKLCRLCPPNSALIKHKESVEDFACLFIYSKALLQTQPEINSPPLRFAYMRHPLPGVDISKLESVLAVVWLSG